MALPLPRAGAAGANRCPPCLCPSPISLNGRPISAGEGTQGCLKGSASWLRSLAVIWSLWRKLPRARILCRLGAGASALSSRWLHGVASGRGTRGSAPAGRRPAEPQPALQLLPRVETEMACASPEPCPAEDEPQAPTGSSLLLPHRVGPSPLATGVSFLVGSRRIPTPSSLGSSRIPGTRPSETSETRFASLGLGQQGGQARPVPARQGGFHTPAVPVRINRQPLQFNKKTYQL